MSETDFVKVKFEFMTLDTLNTMTPGGCWLLTASYKSDGFEFLLEEVLEVHTTRENELGFPHVKTTYNNCYLQGAIVQVVSWDDAPRVEKFVEQTNALTRAYKDLREEKLNLYLDVEGTGIANGKGVGVDFNPDALAEADRCIHDAIKLLKQAHQLGTGVRAGVVKAVQTPSYPEEQDLKDALMDKQRFPDKQALVRFGESVGVVVLSSGRESRVAVARRLHGAILRNPRASELAGSALKDARNQTEGWLDLILRAKHNRV